MIEPEFDEEHLYLVLFGPGYGESVAVRAPESSWLLVDCLSKNVGGEDWIPGVELLNAAEPQAVAVALTHPHGDHAEGFSTLIEHSMPVAVGCVAPYVEPPSDWGHAADAEHALHAAQVEEALRVLRTS